MTYIVASLVERSVPGVSRSSKKAFSQGADLVEVRLDHLKPQRTDRKSLASVRAAIRGPAIATLRSSEEGGMSKLRGHAREKALRGILASGFEYVDLELSRDNRLIREAMKREGGSAIIASVHFGRPVSRKEVERALTKACSCSDFGKVAMPCEHAGQAVMLASIGTKRSAAGDKFILIGMGEQGQLTRVCARQMGSSMVYCCIGGKAAAPGQLDIATQASLDGSDKHILGLLGHPLDHSVSKPMQEEALRKAGLNGAYLNLNIPPEDMTAKTVSTLMGVGVSGLNVTIPHKQRLHRMCSELSPEADATGAVNTLSFEGGMVHGKNTDVIGFTRVIEQEMSITPETEALVVGAGGAARAAVYALGRMGVRVRVAARDPAKARKFARDMGAETTTVESLRKGSSRFDLIVNCTPAGTKGVGVPPVPSRLLRRGVVYFDIVYNPPVTKSMRKASSKGARTIGGLDMLVYQGAESFRSWTGVEPDVAAMRVAARRALR